MCPCTRVVRPCPNVCMCVCVCVCVPQCRFYVCARVCLCPVVSRYACGRVRASLHACLLACRPCLVLCGSPRTFSSTRRGDDRPPTFRFSPVSSARLFVVEGERRRARDRASMEMYVLPLVVPLMPHAALLALLRMRHSLLVHVLREPDVRDARGIFPEKMHVWVQDRRVHGFTVFPQDIIKVKFVEIHSLD